MADFTASNGEGVGLADVGGGAWVDGVYIREQGVKALREFFQAERDEQNGVWRESPDSKFVVQLLDKTSGTSKRSVQVFDETSGAVHHIYEGFDYPASKCRAAAQAWFKAHPVRKPWHDAKQGEVWLLDITGRDEGIPAVVNRADRFATGVELLPIDGAEILNATRIYPNA